MRYEDLKNIVPGLGVLRQSKHGPGIVGRTAPVALAFVLICGFAMYLVSSAPLFVVGILGMLAALVIAYFGAVFWFANKNPRIAAMEGSDVVEYYKIEQTAKDPKIIEGEYAPTANVAPPKAIVGGK
jgi:hypothetical protein